MQTEITLLRYRIIRPTWAAGILRAEIMADLADKLNKKPFQGDAEEDKYGFVKCSQFGEVIFGNFAQKYHTENKDYDVKTKEEIQVGSDAAGDYFFIIFLNKHELLLQAKRNRQLPDKEKIVGRFQDLLKACLHSALGNHTFEKIVEAQESVDREKVVNIFYKEADSVCEMEFTEFDRSLIERQKQERGGSRQKYFNPIEEYQEAMEEAAFRIADHAEKAIIKAKKDQDLKKDPITRALLEGSKKPTKIVYIKDEVVKTASAVTEKRITFNITGESVNTNDLEQLQKILARIDNGDKIVTELGDESQLALL